MALLRHKIKTANEAEYRDQRKLPEERKNSHNDGYEPEQDHRESFKGKNITKVGGHLYSYQNNSDHNHRGEYILPVNVRHTESAGRPVGLLLQYKHPSANEHECKQGTDTGEGKDNIKIEEKRRNSHDEPGEYSSKGRCLILWMYP